MMYFLQGFLPRVLPKGYALDANVFIRPHQGKSDLIKSLRQKAPRLHEYDPPVRLLVIHDQDANDCVELERTLTDTIDKGRRADFPLCVRIACRELENWYLGSLPEVERLYPASRASQLVAKRKYRDCDRLNGAAEMESLTKKAFAKTDCARRMGPIIAIEGSRSVSFGWFVRGLDIPPSQIQHPLQQALRLRV